MTQDESATPKKKLKKWHIAVLVVIVLSVIGSLTGGDDTSSTENASDTAVATTAPEPEVDMFTKRACRKFREFTAEAGKGILTISEMRDKFKDTYESAQFSEVPAITDSATRTLAALTSQDVDALTSATDVLAQTCIQLGQQKYRQPTGRASVIATLILHGHNKPVVLAVCFVGELPNRQGYSFCVDDEDYKKDVSDKFYGFLGWVIFIAIALLVLVFVVAFVHDLFTGQLGGGGGGCNPEYSVCDDGGYDGFGRR